MIGDATRWMAILVVLVTAGRAQAQEPMRSWPGLKVSELSKVDVVDDAGVTTTGRLVRLDPDSVLLLVDGRERRVEAAHIRKIDKHGDSLRNGALVGALIGAGMGVLTAGIADCPGEDPGGNCPGSRAGIFLFSTGFYSAVGTAIDALVVGHTTIYVAPGSASAAIRAPFPNRGHGTRVGMNMRFTW